MAVSMVKFPLGRRVQISCASSGDRPTSVVEMVFRRDGMEERYVRIAREEDLAVVFQ